MWSFEASLSGRLEYSESLFQVLGEGNRMKLMTKIVATAGLMWVILAACLLYESLYPGGTDDRQRSALDALRGMLRPTTIPSDKDLQIPRDMARDIVALNTRDTTALLLSRSALNVSYGVIVTLAAALFMATWKADKWPPKREIPENLT